MPHIIIRGKTKYGKTRSEIEENLRKDGLASLSDEQLAKAKFTEKALKKYMGSKSNFLSQKILNRVK